MLKNVLQICAAVGFLSEVYSTSNIATFDRSPAKWTLKILQDKVSVSALKSIEPGFDFSDDEMKKLKLWKNGVVPFFIDSVSFDIVFRDRIRNFLETTSGLSGLQFLELPTPPLDEKTRWVFFINRRGVLNCVDHNIQNFTNEGVQQIVLGYDCIINEGQLAEVVLLLAGVPPQHNSPDRDKYIQVNMNKILPEKQYLYEKLGDRDWLFHNLIYDFSSAGHYHFHKNTVDGSATITPMKYVDTLVGEGDGFSYADILKIRMLYNYMSKKPDTHSKDVTCKKIFKPGSNLATYSRLKNEDVKPREKPNKYLGLPDDHKQSTEVETGINNEDKNENNNDDDEENDPGNADATAEGNDNKNVDEEIEDTINNQQVEEGNRIQKLQSDPLTLLSDYETDDDKRKNKKNKLKLVNHGKVRKLKITK